MSVPAIQDEAKAQAAQQPSAGNGSLPATAWKQIRTFFADVNYVARRVTELHIPWSARDRRPG
jgi:hypothetical protein